MQATPAHRPPKTDHVHAPLPLETAFDFLNTLELEDGALVERLTSLDVAGAWLAEHGVVHDPRQITVLGRRQSGTDGALRRLIATRTALRDVAHAVAHETKPDASAIEEVNRALAARERIELVASADGVRLGHSHLGDAIDDVLARIAEPIVREIGNGHDDRFRICANDTCRWIFYDESRSGQRRWCDMATCGNQAKARRHRERAKQAETAPSASTTRKAAEVPAIRMVDPS
jgi:predicted RNA-binding Zn ribbon-like protein